MSAAEALRRCPHAVFVRPRHTLYRDYSREVWSTIREIVPTVEQAGIDEGYLDLGEVAPAFDDARALAEAVRAVVRARTRLSCSLGVATSKVVAKVASDRRKPGGLTAVRPGREAAFLAPFPIRLLPGVGPKAEERLQRARDRDDRRSSPRSATPSSRVCCAGRSGASSATARAGSTRGRSRSRPSASRSRRRRPSRATSPTASASTTSCGGCPSSSPSTCAARGQVARTVTTKVRYPDFAIRTRSTSLPVGIDDAERIGELACALLDRALRDRPGAAAARRRRRLRARGARATFARRASSELLHHRCRIFTLSSLGDADMPSTLRRDDRAAAHQSTSTSRSACTCSCSAPASRTRSSGRSASPARASSTRSRSSARPPRRSATVVTRSRVSPRACVDDDVGPLVVRRRVAVDDREPAAVRPASRAAGRRPARPRGTSRRRAAARRRRRAASPASIACSGSSSPNMTMSGLSDSPQTAQLGSGSRSSSARAARRPQREAARGADRAVHLDHVPRAGPLVQAVDVLRDHRLHEPGPLELGERGVAGVRLARGEHLEAQRVELPDRSRVAPPGVDVRDLERVVLRPDAPRRCGSRACRSRSRCRRR